MPARAVTLSFDNGPHPAVTPEVLDILRDRDVKANFFVVGDRLAKPAARDAMRRAAAEGHRIGSHTMTHTTPIGLLDEPAVTALAGMPQWCLPNFPTCRAGSA